MNESIPYPEADFNSVVEADFTPHRLAPVGMTAESYHDIPSGDKEYGEVEEIDEVIESSSLRGVSWPQDTTSEGHTPPTRPTHPTPATPCHEDGEVIEEIDPALRWLWRRMLNLAREMKANPKLANLADAEVKGRVKAYCQEHELPETDSLFFFLIIWPKVIYAAGDGPLNHAMAEADRSPLPRCGEQFSEEPMRRLVKLCLVLKRREDPEPLYIDYENAGKLLGVSTSTAGRMLGLLCMPAVGILKRVEKGHQGRASRYRWIAK